MREIEREGGRGEGGEGRGGRGGKGTNLFENLQIRGSLDELISVLLG
jgi:hypothetical protein